MQFSVIFLLLGLIVGCGSTEIVESPRTGYVSEVGEAPVPKIIWTSRTFGQNYDYLGRVEVRGLTYDATLNRLLEAAQSMRADAVIDVHYEPVGFLTSFQGFAIKYK